MKKDNELSKILDDHYKIDNPYYTRREYQFEGPFTIAQVEEKLIQSHKSSSRRRREIYGVAEKFEDSRVGKDWLWLKAKHRNGDQLYLYVGTSKPSWSQLRGYVLIREKKVVAQIVTAI